MGAKGIFVSTNLLIFSNLVRIGSNLLIMTFIGWRFGGDTLGEYALALAISTPPFAFGMLGLRQMIIAQRVPESGLTIAFVQFVGLIVATLASLTFAFLLFPQSTMIVFATCLIKAADAIVELKSGQFQLAAQLPRLLSITMATTVLNITVSAFAIGFAPDLQQSLNVIALSAWVSLLAYFRFDRFKTLELPVLPQLKKSYSNEFAAISNGSKLGLASLLAAYTSALPQYLLAIHWGANTVGAYAILIYVYSFADIASNSFGQSMLPAIRRIRDKQTSLNFVLAAAARAVKITLIPIAVLVFAYVQIAPFVFHSAGSPVIETSLLLIVAIACLPPAQILGNALLVNSAFITQLIIASASLLAVATTSLLLINQMSLYGALLALGVGGLVRVSVSAVAFRRSARGEVQVG